MTTKPIRPLIALILATFLAGNSILGQKNEIDLEPGEGLLVFKMETNFVNTPFGKFQVILKKKNTLEVKTIVPKQKSQWTVVTLPVGEYELLEFTSPNGTTEFDENNSVQIEDGATTYIGDFTYIAKNRPFKLSPLVETFEVKDNTAGAKEELEEYFTENFRTALVLSDEKPTDREADKIKLERFFPVKKQYTGENLKDRGLVVARIAMEKSNIFMHAAMLGMSRPIITTFSLDFEPTDGSKQIGFIGSDGINLAPYKPLDKQTKGLLVAIEVPPGEYNIQHFKADLSHMAATIYYFSKLAPEVPFTVNSGEITYLGEIFAHPLTEKFLLMNTPQDLEFYINDFEERDMKELYSKFPFLKDLPVAKSILEGQNGWEELFLTGKDPRAMLAAKRKKKSK